MISDRIDTFRQNITSTSFFLTDSDLVFIAALACFFVYVGITSSRLLCVILSFTQMPDNIVSFTLGIRLEVLVGDFGYKLFHDQVFFFFVSFQTETSNFLFKMLLNYIYCTLKLCREVVVICENSVFSGSFPLRKKPD